MSLVNDVICNLCNNSCKPNESSNAEYAEMRASWGYGGYADGQVHLMHICTKCYPKFIEWVKSMGGIIDIVKDCGIILPGENTEKPFRKI